MNNPTVKDSDYPGAKYTIEFQINESKIKSPYILPAYPLSFYHHVGVIALCWGMYENHFNRLLAALLEVDGDTSEPKWKFLSYKRRKRLCRRLIARNFRMRIKLRTYLNKVLDDSTDIQQARNAILHGKTAMRIKAMPDATMDCKLITRSRIRGGKEKETLHSEDGLETMSHDLLHMVACLIPPFKTPPLMLSSRDTRELEALLSRIPIETTLP